MRVLAFSDVHGNSPALAAMLRREDAGSYGVAVFCGDAIGYFPDPGGCVSLLRSVPRLAAVRGNHEEMYLRSRGDAARSDALSGRYGSVYRDGLAAEDELYVSSLPRALSLDIGGLSVLVCHGTPGDPLSGRLYPDTDPEGPGEWSGWDLVLCGHSHYRMAREIGGSLVVNPGSLGQPRDGRGFSYCVIDTDEMAVDFRRAPVDPGELGSLLSREGSPGVVSYLRRKHLG